MELQILEVLHFTPMNFCERRSHLVFVYLSQMFSTVFSNLLLSWVSGKSTPDRSRDHCKMLILSIYHQFEVQKLVFLLLVRHKYFIHTAGRMITIGCPSHTIFL